MTKAIRPIVLGVLGLLWLAPVYLLIVNAAKLPADYSSAEVWKPAFGGALLDNMRDAWERADLSVTVLSTAIYSLTGPLIGVLIGAGVGFAIVALRLRHGFWWFVFVFGGTVFPIQMILMPLFVGYADAGLYDTRLGLILVYSVISVPFSAFVMRNFFSGIAHHVFEAAVMDGATTWRIFWRIYLPMSGSALVAIFILQATFIWNDLLLGLTLSQSDDVRPIMPALTSLQSTYGGSAMPVVLAGGLLVSIPTVLLFLATQRIFSRGLALGQF
ncbi:carbohydrate ABC transporter permease [Phytoactinopolyspora halotolerans]|uniref:Carbohydrate ABC transporter permease n=1 Tax=Phytoactinopolyspora halotolerans TaxID=1981512 RepID=A0A6L9S1N9_9ACTN|nr:carbohydrate ABC transporter permease [Phytoactinopolyspora halotolerans]NED98730.1 carbohydrate ABC transporter permease [Phytoactinopolyspora halotolerans]